MPASTLLFIEQDATGIGAAARRSLRAHVMKGKNRGRPRLSARNQRSPPSDNPSPRVPCKLLWNDFSLTSFPQEMDPEATKLMHRWFLDVSDALFPPQFCSKFDIIKSVWVNCILADEAYFHSTLAISASYVNFSERKPADSPRSLQHICQAYSLVNHQLAGPRGISSPVIAAVVSLAIYQQIHQQHAAGMIHLRGLYRMIELRGGIARLLKEERSLALKPLRLDVELALQSGASTLWPCDELPIHSVLSASSSTKGGLPQIMLDLIVFASNLNRSAASHDTKLDPLDYTETFISLTYRLLDRGLMRRLDESSEEDASRLAMLAFMTTLLLHYCFDNFHGSLLSMRLSCAIQELCTTQVDTNDEGLPFILWAMFMGGISVLKVDECPWLLIGISDICNQLGLFDWPAVHDRLVVFPWISSLHDALARRLWEKMSVFVPAGAAKF